MTLIEIIDSETFMTAMNDETPFPLVLATNGTPVTPESEAIIVEMNQDFEIPAADRYSGFTGLLDFEDIKHLWEGFDRKIMSARQKAEFLIHYAAFDGQPVWFASLPDAK